MSSVYLLLESALIIVGLHTVLGKEIGLKNFPVKLMCSLAIVQALMNYLNVSAAGAGIVYGILFFYARHTFNERREIVIIKLFLHLVFILSTQTIFLILVNLVIRGDEKAGIRAAVTNALVLLFNIAIQKRANLKPVWSIVLQKNLSLILTTMFIGGIALCLLLTNKLEEGFFPFDFLMFILFIGFVVLWIGKWVGAQIKLKEAEREIDKIQQGQEDFQDLLLNVRLRQHEFKNHMSAIFSTHYVHKTYDKLVEAQTEYLEKLSGENRFNSLLSIKEQQLAGFLYRKLLCMEKKGIAVDCRVLSRLEHLAVPVHKMVEMLGILLDNAMEALEEVDEEKKIRVVLEEEKESYLFLVSNPYRFVTREELVGWYKAEKSSKGKERGLGLYYLLQLCRKYQCSIGAECLESDGKYQIQFCLEIKKTNKR